MADPKPAKRKGKAPPKSYWQQTRRPIVCLAFVAPLLVFYEAGVLFVGAEAARNGVDAYLRYSLAYLGLGQYFLLPLLTAAILLAWQHAAGQRWSFRPRVLLGMLIESGVFAVLLFLIARTQMAWFASASLQVTGEAGTVSPSALAKVIGYCGAGVYEELFFRLMLLPVTVAVVNRFGVKKVAATLIAIAVTSLLFSAAHHLAGEAFQLRNFVFRFLAGGVFALLFVARGFGVAVGTHALYDVFTLL